MNKRQKGRQLVKEAIALFKQSGLSCYEVVGSGAGLEKGDIRIPSMDLVIEAKKQKKVALAEWVKQSEREGLGYNKTCLVWQIPNTPHLRADIDLSYFAELLKRNQEPRVKSPDREVAWKGRRAIEDIKTFLKAIER